MAILRNPNKDKFTVIDNYALRDENLSLKARGLLVSMLSLPDNWSFSENGLIAIFPKDGQTSIRSGLKELEQQGYLVRNRARDDHGRISKVEWILYDYPHFENHNLVNHSLENHNLENRPQLNTKQSNTKKTSTDELNTESKRKREPTHDELVERFQSQELADAVIDWLSYKKERRERYKPTGLKSLLLQIEKQTGAHGAHAVADTIRMSMSNGWRGIIWDRIQSPPEQQKSSNPFWEMLREEQAREQSGYNADNGYY